MAKLQFSTSIRNARINQVEAIIGTSPKLRILSGLMPANVTVPQTGLMLCEIPLPSNWLTSGSNGAVSKSGTWSAIATSTGTATYFRILKTDGSVHCQGDVGLSGNVSMILNDITLEPGITVTVLTFSLTEGNP